jgi:hypothetical protein
MADTQLDLFNRKKYTGILPQTTEISPPTSDSSVLQSLPAYHTYLSSGGYSKYTPDDFTSDVRKFGLFVKDGYRFKPGHPASSMACRKGLTTLPGQRQRVDL